MARLVYKSLVIRNKPRTYSRVKIICGRWARDGITTLHTLGSKYNRSRVKKRSSLQLLVVIRASATYIDNPVNEFSTARACVISIQEVPNA